MNKLTRFKTFKAVALIRKLPLAILPGEKLDIVVNIFEEIRALIRASKADEYGADELLDRVNNNSIFSIAISNLKMTIPHHILLNFGSYFV